MESSKGDPRRLSLDFIGPSLASSGWYVTFFVARGSIPLRSSTTTGIQERPDSSGSGRCGEWIRPLDVGWEELWQRLDEYRIDHEHTVASHP